MLYIYVYTIYNIDKTCKVAFFHLYNMRRIRKFLSLIM